MADGIVGKVSVGDGATFTPSVSNSGILSWTNNKNLPNPASVNIAQAVINSGAGLFLPLSGGTMTGNVRWNMPNTETRLFRTDETGKLALYGGVNWNTSANLYLNGNASNAPGQFALVANDGTNSKALTGKPDGTLIWNNHTIALAKDVLPLAGGTMTGAITSSSYDTMLQNSDNSGLRFSGGASVNSGASLVLFGKDNANYPGQFAVRAYDGTLSAYLTGYPDGTLTWAGKNVERVSASGAGYIRYESGVQICWGSNTDNTIPQAVLFPQAFNEVPSISISNGIYNTTAWSKTGFTISAATGHTAPATVYFKYIAVGFWK